MERERRPIQLSEVAKMTAQADQLLAEATVIIEEIAARLRGRGL